MDCFTYPLDTKTLLRKKKQIKRELLCGDTEWIDKKIAVLGGSTTNEVVDQMELALLHHGIRAEFYQSEYGLYYEDAMFDNETLEEFKPDIVYIHTNWRNISEFPMIKDTKDEVEERLAREYKRFTDMWGALKERFRCPIIQNNFDRPNYRTMGNRDIWDCRGRSNYASRLNQLFYGYAQNNDGFYIHDIDYLAQDYGLSKWNDAIGWSMYKYFCALSAIPVLAGSVANIIKSLLGKNKKVLALDLDNTLWGGIVGEDGADGIQVGPDSSQGQVYLEFQEYCKRLQEIGVLLTVNSKNDEENALAGLDHKGNLLTRDDFVSFKANWDNKDENIREIAKELSLGEDSFVFVDDEPVERDIVKNSISGIAVPSVDGVENYISVLDHSGFFETTVISSDDMNKTGQYRARASASNSTYEDYAEYLKSLHMTAYVCDFDSSGIQRIAQLTNKTNQFNLTTKRCTEDDIRRMMEDPGCICMYGRLEDKFCDSGIVTVLVGEIQGAELHIRLWLMSCRVLKRGLEYVMMNTLVSKAAERGIERILGYYYPTKKNGMVSDVFRTMGYALASNDEAGNSVWSLEVSGYKKKETQIEVV